MKQTKSARELILDKKRIIIKIGTSTITYEETGELDLMKLEKLVRVATNLHNQGKEVIIVSSGAIAVGRKALGLREKPTVRSVKQACAAVGQAQLMMVYQKLFAEYNQMTAQILMTKFTIVDDNSRQNAQNTFRELLNIGVIPIVNENDTVATHEIDLGDNDTLSAIVTALVGGDLLLMISDTDGLYTDDPKLNPEASFIHQVDQIDESFRQMAKGPSTTFGTGGMATKLDAARIANESGADMVIANGDNIYIINDIMRGDEVGTLFTANQTQDFDVITFLKENTHFLDSNK